jgi:CAAX protease family protein
MSSSESYVRQQWQTPPLKKMLHPMALALIPGGATYLAVYLEILPNLLYPLLKLVIVLIPFVVWKLQSVSVQQGMAGWWKFPTAKGLLSGLLLASSILGSYFLFFQQLDSSGITAKLISLELIGHYFLAGIFISTINSAIEEWFWRGFIQQQLTRLGVAPLPLILCGGFFFGLHHYFTLLPYFSTGIVFLFTSATMIAGALWSFQRIRGWSLVDCYIGHVCSDLAIIYVGWLMIS